MEKQHFLSNISKKVIILAISVYQKTLSPDHGIFKHKHPYGYCRFYPTCSQYAIESINSHGVVKGGAKAIKRIFRCNPLNSGGYDPVINQSNK